MPYEPELMLPLKGMFDVSAAAVTPGSARVRASSRSQNARRAAGSGYRACGSAIEHRMAEYERRLRARLVRRAPAAPALR
jgi:hypothetical protein